MARISQMNFLKLQPVLSICRIESTAFAKYHNFHPVKNLKGILD